MRSTTHRWKRAGPALTLNHRILSLVPSVASSICPTACRILDSPFDILVVASFLFWGAPVAHSFRSRSGSVTSSSLVVLVLVHCLFLCLDGSVLDTVVVAGELLSLGTFRILRLAFNYNNNKTASLRRFALLAISYVDGRPAKRVFKKSDQHSSLFDAVILHFSGFLFGPHNRIELAPSLVC